MANQKNGAQQGLPVKDVVETNVRPFGIKDELGYMFGDFGNDFFFILVSQFIMLYYTNVLGISAALVGTLFLVGRFVDAFTDIGMGQLVDRSKSHPYGRYRVWIKRMSLPVVIAGVLMFLPFVQNWSATGKNVWMFFTYLLWGSFAYTAINIPYGSMAAAITANPVERGQLSTFRSVGASLAGMFVGMLVPLIVYKNGVLSADRFFILSLVFAVCAFICYTLCHKWCLERVVIEEKKEEQEKKSVGEMVGAFFKNRSLVSIIICSILLTVSMFVAQSMSGYLYNDYFKNPAAMSAVAVVSVAGTLILAPFSKTIIRKWGKKEACSLGLIVAGVVFVLIYMLKITNAWVFVGLYAIASLGSGLFNLMIWAFITDVIDQQEILSGKREDGTVYGIYSFARKIGQAIAGGISGFALTAIGYVSTTGSQVIEQAKSVTDGIYMYSTLVPGIGYIAIGVLLMFWYPLGKKKIAENQKLLGLDIPAEDE